MKTTNKKYYKRIDVPDLKRAGDIKLDESELAWKYQNNTVIISYDKPAKVIEMEKKKKSDIQKLGNQSDFPMLGGGGGGGALSSGSDVKSILSGPQPKQKLPEGQECN